MIGVWASMKAYFAVNVQGTANVCHAALRAEVKRLIHISSAMVYDMAGPHPATEDDVLAPLHEPYSVSKAHGDLLVQRLAREEHLPAVIIRPGTLIGAGDSLNFGRMATRIQAGKGVIIGRGANAIPLFSIDDMVRGLIVAMESDRATGKITRHGVKLYGDDNRISIDKARRELGYEPQMSVNDAVVSACKWYRHSERPTAPAAPIAMSGAAAL